MKCLYCQKEDGCAAACPEKGDVHASSDLRRRWQAGWDTARTGVENPHPKDETFTLGFTQGEASRTPKPAPKPKFTADGRQEVSF